MPEPSVLIIADNSPLRTALESQLRDVGCQVVTCENPAKGVTVALNLAPSVVVVEQDLPAEASLDVCRELQSRFTDQQLPIVLLPLQGKPSSAAPNGSAAVANQIARGISQMLQPIQEDPAAPIGIQCLGLSMDRRRHLASLDGSELQLTVTEFRIVWELARQPGFVVSREQLSMACGNDQHSVRHRAIDAHIKTIRQKLGNRSDLIETVRGIGYRFREPLHASLDMSDDSNGEESVKTVKKALSNQQD